MNIDFHRKWIVYGAAGVPAYLEPTAWTPAQLFYRDTGVSNEGISLWNGEVLDWLFDEDQLEAYCKLFIPKLLSEKWKIYDTWQAAIPPFELKQQEVMTVELSELTDQQVMDLARELFHTFAEQYALNNWIEPVSHYFQQHLIDLLGETGIERVQAQALIQQFGHPLKKNYVKRCLDAYQAAKTPEQVQAVLSEFYYLKNDYLGPWPLTEEGIKEQMSKLKVEEEPPIAHPKISVAAQNYLDALQLTATVQDLRKEWILKWVSAAGRLLPEIAKRKKGEVQNFRFALWTEIIADQIPSAEVLKERMQACVANWRATSVEMVSGQEARQLYQEFKRVVIGVDQVSELKGMAASTGKVTGRAVVITHPSQFGQVKPGDVLVTVMTRPEYLPVMQVAAAFVTDEGGITSHAAIVAREMKKPCVIATKKATKVIQTGQMVEVDATSGTVKILG